MRYSSRYSNSSSQILVSLRLRIATLNRKMASTPSAKTRSNTDETSSSGKRYLATEPR